MSPSRTPIEALEAGEVGYIITGLKDVSELKVGDTLTTPDEPRHRAAAGLPRREADGVRGPVPVRRRAVLRPARRAREAEAQRRLPALRARDQPGARLRVPRRLPRPAAHGGDPRAAGARVRPRADRDHAERRVPRDDGRTASEVSVNNPSQMPDANTIETIGRAVREELRDRPQGVRRHRHGAVPGPPRRVRPHGVPDADARGADLQAAAGRDRARLLRPAEVAHARATRRSTTRSPARATRTWSRSTSC